MIRTGLHLSIAGSLASAAREAAGLGATTFQIFSSSPRMWHASIPHPDDIHELKTLRQRHDLRPLVIHGNYLTNLPSTDAVIRNKSIAAFRGELDRALAIGAEYLVIHPGSYKDQTIESALRGFADSVEESCNGFQAGSLTLLLECTAGQGSSIGGRLEELAELREKCQGRAALPIAFCLDTCHLLAAGYNIASEDGLEETVELAGRVLGWDAIPLIHANDSQHPLGSRRDRHEHIGKGHIGIAAFRRILTHPKLRETAFILETPGMEEGYGRRNLRCIQRLAGIPRPPRAPAPRSLGH